MFQIRKQAYCFAVRDKLKLYDFDLNEIHFIVPTPDFQISTNLKPNTIIFSKSDNTTIVNNTEKVFCVDIQYFLNNIKDFQSKIYSIQENKKSKQELF